MRPVLGTVAMRGVVVIGEGEKDDAPMLYNGEQVGDGTGPEVDIAVDPVDGTTLAAKVLPDAISVVALAERGKVFDPRNAPDASEGQIDTGVDLLLGTGGTPEGVIAAAALRCLGGEIFARLAPRNDQERQEAIDLGYDLDRILTTRDLCGGEDIFFAATGVTDGALLEGVRFSSRRISTTSLSMRARSGTFRFIETLHDPERSTLVPTARANN